MQKMRIGTMFGERNLDDLDFGMGKRKSYRNPMKDSDKDGVNDFADCEPHNPKKQGPLAYAAAKYLEKRKGIVGKAARGYAEYKKGAPEREKARIETLKRRAEIERQRTAIARARAERIRARPTATMDYGRFFGLGAGVIPRAAPKAPKKRKKRKKKKR